MVQLLVWGPGKPYKEPTITVKGQQLQVVDKFTYLGSTLSKVVHIDDEVNAKAWAAFGWLRGSIWDRSGIKHKAEIIQICGAANTIICMQNLDSLPTACQKTEPLLYNLS